MKSVLLPLLLLPSLAALTVAASEAEIAVYDAILASVQPGQTTVEMGDMIVPVETVQLWRQKLTGTRSASQTGVNKWTGGVVYYSFNANVNAANRAHFLDACAEWAAFASLTFTPRVAQTNYIMVNDVPGLGGGNSAVGMIGGAQQLNIGSGSWNRGTLTHEIGHALGLIHEHQRSDRDAFVTIVTANVPGGAGDPNFVRIPTSTNNGGYDFLSVMHYDRDAFTTNAGQDTIVCKPGYTQFQNLMGTTSLDRVLSRGDRDGVAAMYGAGPVLSLTVTNTKDAGPGSLRAALYRALDIATDSPAATPVITFQIPLSDPGFSGGVFTIRPTDRLPAPGPRVTVDATTQTAFSGNSNASGPEVVLSGASISTSSYGRGIWLGDTGATVRGLVIQGFNNQGVLITGSGNRLEGCYIGTSAAGTAAVPNLWSGVEIKDGATGNTVGGTTAAARNVISGNSFQGVSINGAATAANAVEGNYVGLNAAGTAALPNSSGGVQVFGAATDNVIGPGNVISGNTTAGVAISGSGTTDNTVRGNFIGSNAAGTAAVANTFSGVMLYGGPVDNNIGPGNVISGNTNFGVSMQDTSTTDNEVLGNFIGLNPAGTAALPNGWAGVGLAAGATGNIIGGFTAAARNVISGNGNQGVTINGAGTNGNRVAGNYIGTNAAGTAVLGNTWPGVEVFSGAQNNIIGGVQAGAGNVISGNPSRGLSFSGTGTNGNTAAGNLIGLNAAGTAALANAGPGIAVFSGAKNNIIGAAAGGRNFIAGNTGPGVSISSTGTDGTRLYGNSIGVTPAGTVVANSGNGVEVFSGPLDTQAGGPLAGSANLIRGNTGAGVAVFDTTTGVNVQANSIYENGGLAMDLGGNGPTPNDTNDPDTGPNLRQNFPVLTAAVLGTATVLTGSLNTNPGTAVRIDYYASPSGDEGRYFLGSQNATTNASGNFTINHTLAACVPAGFTITATATGTAGTSEFSAPRPVTTTDTDSDGLPNAWETANGLSTSSNDAALDADRDGASNLDEFRAGTDPLSAASVLRPNPPTLAAGSLTFSFPSINGRTYRVEYSSALTGWQLLADQILSNGAPLIVTDPSAGGAVRRYYRVVPGLP